MTLRRLAPPAPRTSEYSSLGLDDTSVVQPDYLYRLSCTGSPASTGGTSRAQLRLA